MHLEHELNTIVQMTNNELVSWLFNKRLIPEVVFCQTCNTKLTLKPCKDGWIGYE
jgi:hypothetical protein